MEECYHCLYEVEAGPVVYTLFHYYRDSKKIMFNCSLSNCRQAMIAFIISSAFIRSNNGKSRC